MVNVNTDKNITIIGCGVVGLSVSRELSKNFDSICIIEKNKSFGLETSSRNSEVIHSGVYYPNNSLKSILCIKGRNLLYNYLEKNNISYNKTGKLIIGHNLEDLKEFNKIQSNALKNGVSSNLLRKNEIEIIEPYINAAYAVHFKETGVFDSHAFMNSLYQKV